MRFGKWSYRLGWKRVPLIIVGQALFHSVLLVCGTPGPVAAVIAVATGLTTVVVSARAADAYGYWSRVDQAIWSRY